MGMKLAATVRKGLGLNAWNMSKRLGKTIQAYQAFEKETKNPNLKDVILLYDIATVELGWKAEEFVEELRKEIKKGGAK